MILTLLKYKFGRELGKIFLLFSSMALAACMPEYGELDTTTAEKYDVQQCVDNQAQAKSLIEEQVLQGETQYQQQCASCHGANNEGTKIATALKVEVDFNRFINATVERMPMAEPAMCDADCAAKIAQFLSPESAQSVSQCESSAQPDTNIPNDDPATPGSILPGLSAKQVSSSETSNSSNLSTDTNTGIYSVTASGGDIWGTSDDFFFVNQPLEGNGSITAKVLSFNNTSGWSKTGVMIRDGLEENAKHASLFLTGGQANGLAFQWRENSGGTTSFSPGENPGTITAPIWLKLERNNNLLNAYQSSDGIQWMWVASRNIEMNAQIYLGLATSPHPSNEGELVNVTFSNVMISNDAPTETEDAAAAAEEMAEETAAAEAEAMAEAEALLEAAAAAAAEAEALAEAAALADEAAAAEAMALAEAAAEAAAQAAADAKAAEAAAAAAQEEAEAAAQAAADAKALAEAEAAAQAAALAEAEAAAQAAADAKAAAEAAAAAAAEAAEGEACNAITGKDFWKQTTCANCHGETNQGAIANATNLNRLVTGNLMESLTDVVGLAKYINDNMPSDPSLCVGDAPGSCAYDTATYIFSLQNDTQECETEGESSGLVITQKPLSNVLYKASMSLAGRLPTDQELKTIEDNGLNGLDSVLDNVMVENAFYDRLKEIYNDMLLLGPKDADQDGYDKEWYKNFTDDESKYAKTLSYDAFNDEIFLLMRYVVENDRPFTEFLTADYTVVNPYSAHVFGVYDDLSFDKWTESEFPNQDLLTDDPYDLKAVKIAGLPHAGALTTRLFLDESDTNNVNRNRHRSYLVFDHFLNFNLFSIPGQRPMATSSSLTEVIDNPTCSGCHNIMDPVSSSFQNFNDKGVYKIPNTWYSDKGEMKPAGFAATDEVFDPEASEDPIQLLAQRVANDPSFAEATVKRIAEGLTGQKMLRDVEAIIEEDVALFEVQQSLLSVWKTAFINSGYNLKSLIKTIIKSPYYAPESVTGVTEIVADKIGAVRILSPEMLTRKYLLVMGEGEFSGITSNKILYGGIDYDLVTERLLEPNGFMTAMQETYANKMACDVVNYDFQRDNDERLYFTDLTLNDLPSDASHENNIRAAIQKLMWRMWGQQVNEDDEQVNQAYNLLKDVQVAGMNDNDASSSLNCYTDNGRVNNSDNNYIERSWNLLVVYLASDFQFLYE